MHTVWKSSKIAVCIGLQHYEFFKQYHFKPFKLNNMKAFLIMAVAVVVGVLLANKLAKAVPALA